MLSTRPLSRRRLAGVFCESIGVWTAATITNDSSKDSALDSIAKAQAEAGDMAGSKATVATFTDDDERRFALGRIAEAQAAAGDFTGAKATAADAAYKSLTLLIIIATQAKAGGLAGAETTVGTFDSDYDRSCGYVALVNGLLDAAGKPGSGDDD